jgi:hypothetical protein
MIRLQPMMGRLLAVKLNQGPWPAGPDDGLPYNGGFGASQPIRHLKMAERGSRRGDHPGGQDIYLRRAKLGKKTGIKLTFFYLIIGITQD